jgi:flagellin
MALGVLNNLSAIYAENNLNNTNNSLQTVLQQLSSGSRINSGADDAAGLSLVNGLGANSSALTQSKTNATEGAGLLQVADGALSQVTSLLNRAITLATEASNGTLNSTQEGAANQEYQSILSEVNNIGQTTTYNQQQVFNGKQVAIYTGDSSTAGSSIDELNIRGLSEASMGDSGGVMAYSDGSNNVFMNLSHTNASTGAVTNAQATDTLNAGGTTTINVNYLVKGANGTESAAQTSISVGTGTSFANTANGLISAINSAGLGLTASFTTQAQAGISGGGTQTGIQITGGLIAAGVDPNAESTSGTLNPGGITNEDLTQGQTITVKVGGVTAAAVTIGSSTSTLTGLMNAINANVGGAAGLVTASIVTNGNGSQSLALADTLGGGALTVTTASNPLGPNALTDGASSIDSVSLSFTSANYTTGQTGTDATATLGMNGTNTAGDVLTGGIVLSNNLTTAGISPMTFVMGAGAASGTIAGNLTGGSTFTVNGDTLGNLATAIQAELGVTATVGSSGITMTSDQAGTTLELVPGAGNNTLSATPALTVTNNEGWAPASPGSPGNATLTMNGDNGFAVNGSDVVSGNLVLLNGNLGNEGSAVTFAMGGVVANASSSYVVVGVGGAGSATMAQLETAITGDVALGITGASLATGALVLTGGAVGTTITPTSTLNYAQNLAKTGPSAGNVGALSTGAQVTTQVGGALGISTTSDILKGNLVLTNDGVVDTFAMGGTAGAGTVVVGTAGQNTATMQQLLTALNGTNDPALGITASLNPANGTISFTSAISTNGAAPNIGVTSTLADVYSTQFTTPAMGSTDIGAQYQGGILTLQDGGSINGLNGTLTGTLTITSDTTAHAGGYTASFVMGQAADTNVGNTWNLTAAHSNIAGMLAAINGTGAFAGIGAGAATALNTAASVDTATGGLFVQSVTATDSNLTAVTAGLTDNVNEAPTAGLGGAATANAQVLFGNAGTNRGSDPVIGTITLTNNSALYGGTSTFVMDGSAGHVTLGNLATLIGDANIGLSAAVGATGLLVRVSDQSNMDFTSAITLGAASSLTDGYGMLLTGTPGVPSVQAENATATVGTVGYNNSGSDTITGSIVLTNGGIGGTQTFTMGMGVGEIGGTRIADLAQAIDNSSLGLRAQVNATTGALELESNVGNTSITAISHLNDSVAEGVTNGSPDPGQASQESTTTLNLAGGATNLQGTDVLTGAPGSTGSITITANSKTETFAMGATAHVASGGLGTLNGSVFTVNGNTVADLEAAINASTGPAGLNITASNTGSDQNLLLKSNIANGTTIGVSGDTLKDAFNNPASVASLGTFSSAGDVVSGTVSFNLGGGAQKTFTVIPGETVTGLMNQINSNNYQYGVSAAIASSGGNTYGTATSDGFVSLTLTSNTYGTAGEIENTSNTHVTDTAPTALLSYQSADPYNTGLSSSSIASNTAIYDSSSGQTNTLAGLAGIVSNSSGSSGIATISYSDGAGQALNGSDLSNQTDAQTALNDLNLAISDVAAQDGYIGAQINTLNSISQVMSTQQENVVSAQNAIQATDYASATSNMSKYEILSQTGIAALAQANSVQQEVTKLLQ